MANGNMYRKTQFRGQGGRRAGTGITEDDYSESSYGGGEYNPHCWPRFPNDDVKPEELNGPCIIIQKGREKE